MPYNSTAHADAEPHSIEWTPRPNARGQEKHGVAFAMAQFAFADPVSVGWEMESLLSDSPTVTMSSVSTELAIGARERESMSEKIRYTDEPLEALEVVPDFLPRPEDLVFRSEGVKVTISLSKRSVEFFKNEARKHNTQYQRMIRRLLDAYAEHHAKRPPTTRSARTRDKSSRAG